MNNRQSERSQRGPKKEQKTSHLNGGSSKYSILSILRGGARTMVVPVLAIAAVIFFGQLATTSSRYQEQLDTIHDNTTITGNYTDIKGKQVGGLVLNAFDVFSLYRTGQVSAMAISTSRPYYYLGISALSDGTDLDILPFFVPPGFSGISASDMVDRGPDLTATNDIFTSPEFLYADDVFMDFLDGYNETFLTAPFGNEGIFKCMIPTSLMEEQDINLGDIIRVVINDKYNSPEFNYRKIFRHYDLLVVGSYEKQSAEDTIYVPLSLFFDTSFFWDTGKASANAQPESFKSEFTFSEIQEDMPLSLNLKSTHFTVSDTHSLESFKDYLTDYGYSQVNNINSVREFIVLKDASFNDSVASVKQQINYINTLNPFLYVLVGIIALVVSYLIVVSRKMEFAIMRGLGATRIRSFFSFFNEQSLLCILGIMIGFSIWVPVWGAPKLLHYALSAGFLVCYFIGSAISITIMNHTNVLTILTDKD